jgi:glycosyltransferase involved in cell wall biosynthesis
MKILLVNTLYSPNEIGGAERMVQRLAHGLRRIGHEPEVACLAPDGHATSANVDGVIVHRFPLRNVYPLFPAEQRPTLLKPLWHAIDSSNAAMARELDRLVVLTRPDVVHTHNVTGFSPLIWSAVSRRGIPVVHTLHDHYLLCLRATMFARGKNCSSRHLSCAAFSFARLRHSSRVAAVVGVSRYILDRHLFYGAFSRASIRRVIRNPMFGAASVEHRVSGANGLRVGYLGRLAPAKGVDVLLTACQAIPGTDWTLRVAGTGLPAYENELKARFSGGQVEFLGEVDARALLQTIDVLVAPSRSNEALPMVVAEAYSAGVPVIAARIGGLPEIVDEGRTGFVFNAGDERELSRLLGRLVAAPALVRSMRADCLAASAQYAPDVIAGEYADVYRATLTARSRRTPS